MPARPKSQLYIRVEENTTDRAAESGTDRSMFRIQQRRRRRRHDLQFGSILSLGISWPQTTPALERCLPWQEITGCHGIGVAPRHGRNETRGRAARSAGLPLAVVRARTRAPSASTLLGRGRRTAGRPGGGALVCDVAFVRGHLRTAARGWLAWPGRTGLGGNRNLAGPGVQVCAGARVRRARPRSPTSARSTSA